MAYGFKAVDVWVADIVNAPGMLARVLEGLHNAGAQLEFMIARRVTERSSRVFLAPLKGAKQLKAAADAGLVRAAGLHTLRIEGPDRPGLGAAITRAVAAKDLNLRGASAAAVGRNLVLHLAFVSGEELKEATKVVRSALKTKARRA